MIEYYLDSARKTYIKAKVPDYLLRSGWDDLRGKLAQRENITNHRRVARGLFFVSLIILFTASVVGAAQAAKPGDKLYQVKILADDVYAGVLGKYEIKVERRAKEVIDLSTNSTAEIDKATRQYKKTLEETQKEIEESGREEYFKQSLEAQEEKFKEEMERNPKSRDHLEEVLKQTEKTRGEVQGEKDED